MVGTPASLSRRAYGITLGTAGLSLLAGCLDGDDTDDDTDTDEGAANGNDTGDTGNGADDADEEGTNDTDEEDGGDNADETEEVADGSEENNSEDEEEDADNGGNEDGGDEDDGETMLTVVLENEEGEPVSEGPRVLIEADDRPIRHIIEHEIEDGVAEPEEIEPGDYTVVVEGEGFDTVEESVTLEEGRREELTVVLEGATGDSDGEGDAADGEGEEGTEGDDKDDTNETEDE